MDLGAAVDLYCERSGPGLFAEPLNALSNFAFLGASVWLLRRLRRDAGTPGYARLLAALIFLIGLGSLAFHTFAQVWAEILDVGCIALFIYFFVACFFRRFLGWRWELAVLAMPGFWVFGKAITALFAPGALNGSVDYLPAFAGLVLMAAALRLRGQRASAWLTLAAAVFLASLGFRTFDLAWCARFPLGTHWIWHTLNAVVLSLATLSLAAGPDENPRETRT